MDDSTDDTLHLPDHRARELLDVWISSGPTPADETEAKRIASSIFGRPDGLELLREITSEEGMLEVLLDRMRAEGGSKDPALRARDARVHSLPYKARPPHPWTCTRSWYGSARSAAAMIFIAGGLAALGLHLVRSENGRGPEPVLVATLPGQRTTVALPDGSHATLAPNSRITYAISAGRGPRDVSLDGEAYFEVRHDEARPFQVRTASAVVKDLGTAFMVREYSADVRTRVAVRSGAVAISAKNASDAPATGLRAGQAVDIDSAGTVVRLTGDTTSYWAWTSGRLVFDAVPLPEVLTRLSRWYGVEFRLTDSTIAAQYFTGAFDAVSLPQALEILGPLVHARFEQRARLVIVTPRPGGR